MKLAEALMQRADAKRRFDQLKARLLRNAKVQEGDRPAEEPMVLLAEVEQVTDTLVSLIQRINRTNVATHLDDGLTLADALALRDVLQLRQGVYGQLAEAAAVRQDRYSRTEVRYVSTVDGAAIQAQADALAMSARQLDAQIQAANWLVDLSG